MAKLDSTTVYGDLTVTGLTKFFEDGLASVVGVAGTHTLSMDVQKNFLVTVIAGTNTLAMTGITSAHAGRTGMIILKNPSSGTIIFNQLPVYMKTPSGADINFVVDINAVSIISYFVVDATTVICNYVGDFK